MTTPQTTIPKLEGLSHDEKALLEQRFWQFVATAGWHGIYRDHPIHSTLVDEMIDNTAVTLVSDRSIHEIELFAELFKALQSTLKTALSPGFESGLLTCGDDSFDDLSAHLIGLGEATFNAVKADPYLAVGYERLVPESFAYVFTIALGKA